MTRLLSLLEQRTKIITHITQLSGALAGNISKSRVPPHTGNYYWRLTWKEKQKTKVQYIRQEELELVRDGVSQFAKLRKAILRLGTINREIMLLQRDKK